MLNYREQFVAALNTAASQGGHLAAEAQNVAEELKNFSKQLTDQAIMVRKPAGGKSIVKLFEDGDNMTPSVGTLSGNKLAQGEMMLLTGIQMLSGVSTTDESAANVDAIDYGTLAAVIANGEFTLKVGGREIISRMAASEFVRASNERKGYIELKNPKLIPSDVSIEAVLEWSSSASAAARTYVKCVLSGIQAKKA